MNLFLYTCASVLAVLDSFMCQRARCLQEQEKL